MPKPRVYVETTVPSFYHDPRTSPAVLVRRRWTRLWWAGAAERYELVTSEYVVEELAAGSMDLARERLRLIQSLRLLGSTARMLEAAQIYVDQKLMPAYPPYDAYHLALASCHDCDFILTWNCKHLANPSKAGRVERINLSLGLYVPRLVTPQALLRREP
ncbi:type II toxin-antitoxin system VapC family toxin [Longimicrobium sp.]|jgi:predicted nucleic acid-binding protein|uniref:type II toxin-antitoxin system VapC family toxin n=1 Tax=Longimicrobium sp. TaxID=2029185 RepID=UPI002EDA4960